MELIIYYTIGFVIAVLIGYYITRWYHDIAYRNDLLEQIRDELMKLNSDSLNDSEPKTEQVKKPDSPKNTVEKSGGITQNLFLFILIAAVIAFAVFAFLNK